MHVKRQFIESCQYLEGTGYQIQYIYMTIYTRKATRSYWCETVRVCTPTSGTNCCVTVSFCLSADETWFPHEKCASFAWQCSTSSSAKLEGLRWTPPYRPQLSARRLLFGPLKDARRWQSFSYKKIKDRELAWN